MIDGLQECMRAYTHTDPHTHTSCGGMSMVTILRSIFSTLSRQGRTKKSPGPLAFFDVIRPSLKMTARSYSLTICAEQDDRAKTHNCK